MIFATPASTVAGSGASQFQLGSQIAHAGPAGGSAFSEAETRANEGRIKSGLHGKAFMNGTVTRIETCTILRNCQSKTSLEVDLGRA